MKKNTKLTYILVLFIYILSIIFFAYLFYLYKSKEGFSVNNELVSSLKETLNNIFNPIKRSFRTYYNNTYDTLQHYIKKFNYHN
jgi:hypothetical protein